MEKKLAISAETFHWFSQLKENGRILTDGHSRQIAHLKPTILALVNPDPVNSLKICK